MRSRANGSVPVCGELHYAMIARLDMIGGESRIDVTTVGDR